MGRPIKKTWFGDPASPGFQIEIVTSAGNEYIVEQTGTRKYITNSGNVVFLVNKDTGLTSSEGYIKCRPFGAAGDGSQDEIVSKLTQHRISTFAGNNYSWNQSPEKAGEAQLVSPTSQPTESGFQQPQQPTPPVIPDPITPDEPEVTPEPEYPKYSDDKPNVSAWDYKTESETVAEKKQSRSDFKRSSKVKKEQSKPIEDLLESSDNSEV